MTFGQKIKHLRTKSNLTQKELAEKMNVTFQTISKWESDTNEPDIESIRRLSNIFGRSIEYLFSEEIEEEKKEEPIIEEKATEEKEETKEEPLIEPEEKKEEQMSEPPAPPVEEKKEEVIPVEEKKEETKETKPVQTPIVKKGKKTFSQREDHKVLIWSIVACVVNFIISLVCFIVYRAAVPTVWVVLSPFIISYAVLADVYCIFSDTYISDVFVSVATKSIKFPGLIFSWSIDGLMWLIGMKILFAILGFFVSLAIISLAVFISAFLAVFSFIPILIKNSK